MSPPVDTQKHKGRLQVNWTNLAELEISAMFKPCQYTTLPTMKIVQEFGWFEKDIPSQLSKAIFYHHIFWDSQTVYTYTTNDIKQLHPQPLLEISPIVRSPRSSTRSQSLKGAGDPVLRRPGHQTLRNQRLPKPCKTRKVRVSLCHNTKYVGVFELHKAFFNWFKLNIDILDNIYSFFGILEQIWSYEGFTEQILLGKIPPNGFLEHLGMIHSSDEVFIVLCIVACTYHENLI